MRKLVLAVYRGILAILILCLSTDFSFAENDRYKISITTVPAGAEVILDSVSAPLKSPVRTTSSADRILMTVAKPGFKEYKATVKLKEGQNNIFIRLSPLTSKFTFIKQFKTGIQPKDLIFSPDGRYLIISLLEDRGIQYYDMKTGSLKKIDLTGYTKTPYIVEGVFTPDGKEFWFNQMSQKGMVYVLSMENFSIKKTIPTHGNWSKVGEFSPDGKTYYVSNWLTNDISVIDVKNYCYVKKFGTKGKAPRGLGFSDDGRFVYVVFYDSGEIMKFSVTDNYKMVSYIKNGGTNGRFRIDRVKQIAYINNMRLRKVFVYDLKTDKITGEFNTGVNPNNILISPDRKHLYVSNRGPNNPKGYLYPSPVDGKIQVFAAGPGYPLIEELGVGNQPIGLAITPDNKTLAISNFMDNTVELYRIEL